MRPSSGALHSGEPPLVAGNFSPKVLVVSVAGWPPVAAPAAAGRVASTCGGFRVAATTVVGDGRAGAACAAGTGVVRAELMGA